MSKIFNNNFNSLSTNRNHAFELILRQKYAVKFWRFYWNKIRNFLFRKLRKSLRIVDDKNIYELWMDAFGCYKLLIAERYIKCCYYQKHNNYVVKNVEALNPYKYRQMIHFFTFPSIYSDFHYNNFQSSFERICLWNVS